MGMTKIKAQGTIQLNNPPINSLKQNNKYKFKGIDAINPNTQVFEIRRDILVWGEKSILDLIHQFSTHVYLQMNTKRLIYSHKNWCPFPKL